jgi:chromosome segregation ATPase
MSKVTLKEKVANYKLLAREALRMELITPRLSKIANLEVEVKSVEECKADLEHEILVENYEISKLDTDHPDYKDFKTEKEEVVKQYTEEVATHVKGLEELAKQIAEQKDGIAKIESGEVKVSLDALNDLVSKMIEQDALNAVATVE